MPNPNGVRDSDMPGAVICLCVRPEYKDAQAECQKCHKPLLERMSLSQQKALTYLELHASMISVPHYDGVKARYMAAR